MGLGVVLAAGLAEAQQSSSKVLSESDLYCTGVATDQPVPADTYLISERIPLTRILPARRSYLHQPGRDQGVKVGDIFEVVRPVSDPMEDTWFKVQSHEWFKWQSKLIHAMGPCTPTSASARHTRAAEGFDRGT